MSVLVVGGDKVNSIKEVLKEELGADRFIHYTARNKKPNKNGIPKRVDLMVFLVDYLNHDIMKKFKNIAKRRGLPFITTHSASHLKECLGKMRFIFDPNVS